MDYGLWTIDYVLWTMDYGLWTMNYGLWTMDYALWTNKVMVMVWHLYSPFPYAVMRFTTLCGDFDQTALSSLQILFERKFCADAPNFGN